MKSFNLFGSAAVPGIRAELQFSKLWEPTEYGAQIILREALEPTQAWLELAIVRPMVFEIMKVLEATRVGMVVAQRIDAGKKVEIPGGPWFWIVVQNLNGATVRIAEEEIHPVGGEVWQFLAQGDAAVLDNQSTEPAVSLIMEIVTR